MITTLTEKTLILSGLVENHGFLVPTTGGSTAFFSGVQADHSEYIGINGYCHRTIILKE